VDVEQLAVTEKKKKTFKDNNQKQEQHKNKSLKHTPLNALSTSAISSSGFSAIADLMLFKACIVDLLCSISMSNSYVDIVKEERLTLLLYFFPPSLFTLCWVQ